MFTVEFVILKGHHGPRVVETTVSQAAQIDLAAASARTQLQLVKQRHPEKPADGFQIKDAKGEIILRSWETTRHG